MPPRSDLAHVSPNIAPERSNRIFTPPVRGGGHPDATSWRR
ncbi:hypothetical protein STRAU_3164 [Streptomyces aurantiacus JA 4570]|uniref:Uncharacterized protein n=1 Tax=Streptomyces aurantiacus JA 4570 TaxID=1286094 RepID=S3ZKP5_9ACTN|nr:hypothetical protein STRAU_3164 [Streptomyces aurantiacus JA 4570]